MVGKWNLNRYIGKGLNEGGGQKGVDVLTDSLRSQFIKVSLRLPTVTAELRKGFQKNPPPAYWNVDWCRGITFSSSRICSHKLSILSKTCWNFFAPCTLHRILALGMALRRNCPAVQPTFYHSPTYIAHQNVAVLGPHTFLGVRRSKRSATPTWWKDIFRLQEMRAQCSHLQGCVAENT